MNDLSLNFEQILESENAGQIIEALKEFPTASLVEGLEKIELEKCLNFLKLIPAQDAGRIMSDLSLDKQLAIFKSLDRNIFSNWFDYMFSDMRADLYQALTKEDQIELIPYLEKKTREDVMVLSSYPPEMAGGIMSTDFATVKESMSVKEAWGKIKKDNPSQKMIYYIYVVDENMKMIGMMTIKDLIMSESEQIVRDLYQEFFIYGLVNEDRESIAQKIEKYDLVALPILNNLHQIVGIVSHEDAIDVIQAEHTEDMEKFMGITPSSIEETYLDTPAFKHFYRRATWIVLLAGVGLISGHIIQHYQPLLEKLLILALYMPMMTATGGNSGSQAATVIIRALSLGELSEKNWFAIFFKEAKISFMLSLCIGIVIFIKIKFFTYYSALPMGITMMEVGELVSIAMGIQVITSTIIGAGLPLIVSKLGGDPAVAASPAISTVVDITGLMIYFNVATLFIS